MSVEAVCEHIWVYICDPVEHPPETITGQPATVICLPQRPTLIPTYLHVVGNGYLPSLADCDKSLFTAFACNFYSSVLTDVREVHSEQF